MSQAQATALAPRAGLAEWASWPVTMRAESRDAFMRVRHLHHRRFADDHRARARNILAETADEIERALASRLFVVAQKNMDRPLAGRRP